MTIGANSYGSAAGVAALTPRFTADGSFDLYTRPTLLQVESWIDQVSGVLNLLLAEQGIAVPVTQADSVQALAILVNQSVADLVLAANSSGRFYTDRALQSARSPLLIIQDELTGWIQSHAQGLAAMGAAMQPTGGRSILTRDTDNSGAAVPPLFERRGFGETPREWDR